MSFDAENKYNNTDRACDYRVVIRRYKYNKNTQSYIICGTKTRNYFDYDTAQQVASNARELNVCEIDIYHRRTLLEQLPLNVKWE